MNEFNTGSKSFEALITSEDVLSVTRLNETTVELELRARDEALEEGGTVSYENRLWEVMAVDEVNVLLKARK